ncbi:MAG: glutamate-1-semialdehyde 2,1-aminomutase [Acidobacteriota bacterium]|nr:glutamate-1-semialdehyde 2,1-aminomutase [Acidobacteriota bacterium]
MSDSTTSSTSTSTMGTVLARAEAVMPGGVSSPVRAFRSVGGEPVFVRAADGAYLEDLDGRRYIDYICGYGPHLLGHRHPAITEALARALERGTTFGAPTVEEIELAELLIGAMPSLEMVRLVNSGTEATMSALRLARAATGRAKVVKFAGCYHGHADPYLVAAGSGAKTFGVPSSPGVPPAVTADTLVAPYNDLAAVEELFRLQGAEIAAVIVEPIAGNMGMILPRPGYLEGLRRVCTDAGAVLIFDEVMTGFRVAPGGAQELYGVVPDLTTLGKVIGGGLPIAAYGGRRDLMSQISPSGPVYQAGTLSGNPLAVAAGIAALRVITDPAEGVFPRLEATGTALEEGLREVARRRGVPCRVLRRGGMLGFFLSEDEVHDQDAVDATDQELFKRLFHGLLKRGVHLPPSAYEAFFFSTAHGEEEVARTLEAFDQAFAEA